MIHFTPPPPSSYYSLISHKQKYFPASCKKLWVKRKTSIKNVLRLSFTHFQSKHKGVSESRFLRWKAHTAFVHRGQQNQHTNKVPCSGFKQNTFLSCYFWLTLRGILICAPNFPSIHPTVSEIFQSGTQWWTDGLKRSSIKMTSREVMYWKMILGSRWLGAFAFWCHLVTQVARYQFMFGYSLSKHDIADK